VKMSGHSDPPPAPAGGTAHARSVAIVDDDPQISQALGQWAQLQGLQAWYFACAEDLLKTLAQDPPHLALHPGGTGCSAAALVAAILDLNLPGLSGLALAHRLRAMDANLPLVVVTALREDERRHYGSLPVGVPCLTKPFDLDALDDALQPVLH